MSLNEGPKETIGAPLSEGLKEMTKIRNNDQSRNSHRTSGKQEPLDIPEMGSGDQTNTDSWIYQRYDQVTRQTQTPGYTRGGIR
jgi:hypothetical protein